MFSSDSSTYSVGGKGGGKEERPVWVEVEASSLMEETQLDASACAYRRSKTKKKTSMKSWYVRHPIWKSACHSGPKAGAPYSFSS